VTKTAITAAIVALLAHATDARADSETADAAFKRGQAAIKAGRIHDGCQAFEASDKLEAKVETELSLAMCYEEDGKPVAAARLYRALADKDSNAERRKMSSEKVAKLEAKAPKLRIVMNQRPDGLVIKVDGVLVPNSGDVLVDVGPHEIVASAPGMEGHASAPVDRDRAIVDVIVRLEPKSEPTPAPAAAKPATKTEPTTAPSPTPATEPATASAMTSTPAMTDTETAGGDHHKRNAALVGGAGLGLLVGSVVLFATSSSKFDDEHALCPHSKCATEADLTQAKSLVSDARAYRGVSYGVGIGGVALLGIGAYLLLAPHGTEASHVSFQVGPGKGQVTYTAHF